MSLYKIKEKNKEKNKENNKEKNKRKNKRKNKEKFFTLLNFCLLKCKKSAFYKYTENTL